MLIPPAVQERLAARGLYPGKIDGDLGPLGLRALMAVAADRPLTGIDWDQARGLWAGLVEGDVTTRLQVLHALAQACKETDWFKTMVEYGGPGYFAQHYDGRMGNAPGEGYRFRGRGFPQLTGHDNYADMGPKVGHDLVANPDLAADPRISGQIFGRYWRDHGCNALACVDDLAGVTRKINGGENGLNDRKAALDRLKSVWP